MTPNDPVIAAAAILLGLVPGQHAQSAHQLPNPPPYNCASGWDHDCKTDNHITIRWVGNEPASAPHGVTVGHANPHRLAIIRGGNPPGMEDDPRPDPPRHHHHRHHGHHRHHR